jgi:tRNA pseudouridine38-40 synthase
MSVIRLLIAYDGTDFRGWARQRSARTVQGVLEEALAPLMGGSAPRLSVAGRTDAGVHAIGQVASFDAPPDLEPARVQRSVNGMLAPEVVVRAARRAPHGFDARHSATAREYRYRIDTGPLPDPLTARYVWHRPGPLRVGAMRAAARPLVGEHDFASFCRRPELPAGTVRRLERLAVSRSGDEVHVSARANAFCHQMVRALVGTLVRVGDGRIAAGDIAAILRAGDRERAAQIAPPHGLVLVAVRYGPRRQCPADSLTLSRGHRYTGQPAIRPAVSSDRISDGT